MNSRTLVNFVQRGLTTMSDLKFCDSRIFQNETSVKNASLRALSHESARLSVTKQTNAKAESREQNSAHNKLAEA